MSALAPWMREFLAGDDPAKRARQQGVSVLLTEAGASTLPPGQFEQIKADTVAQILWETQHIHAVAKITACLTESGIDHVIFKGTALAYSVYADPCARVRGDTDILVSPDMFETACTALESAGFTMSLSGVPRYLEHARTFQITSDHGIMHVFDLHHQISWCPVPGSALTFREIFKSSRVLETGNGCIRTPAAHINYAIAALHREISLTGIYLTDAKDVAEKDRMIWTIDLWYLAQSFSDNDWEALGVLARETGLSNVVARTFPILKDRFDFELLPHVPETFSVGRNSPVETFLNASKARRMWIKFNRTQTLGARAQTIRELLFPPREYMEANFGDRLGFLPWLYAKRSVRGLVKALT